MGSAFSCGEPRKRTTRIGTCSNIPPTIEGSKPLRNFKCSQGRTADGLKEWKTAKDRRVADEMRAQDLEPETFFRGRSDRRPNDNVEPNPSYYDSSKQRQQRELAGKSHARRQPKFMSGVEHYPAFEEIMQQELQAPHTQFERYNNKERPKRHVDSGVEHYAPMVAIDEYERPNPLALDSRYVTALDKLEGRSDVKEGRSLTQKRNVDAKDDPWGSDGGIQWPEDLFPQTRKEEKPRRRPDERGQKMSSSSRSKQSRDRGRRR